MTDMTKQRATHEQLLLIVVMESALRECFTQPGEASDRASVEQRQADLDALPRGAQEAVITLNRDGWVGSWPAMLETAAVLGEVEE